jgi:prepilin-type N-terminal cleavage/methylation domain-containing protein
MRLRRCAAAARRRLAAEHGYSLSEMLVVMAIIGIVLAALTQLFVSASTAQVDMTRRFEAQQDMRLALDKLRREIHCANNVIGTLPSPLVPTSSLTISLGSYCPTNGVGAAQITWCTKDKNGNAPPGAGAPYSLWRYPGSTCKFPDDGTGRKWADYLVTGQIFADYIPPASGSLGKLSVNLPVDLTPNDTKQRYTLQDDIVLRNTPRS